MKKYQVVQWGSGWVGMEALRYILANPKFELVGLKCHTEEKVGKDGGVLSGGKPVGVKATNRIEEILALDADCVIFMPRDMMTDPTVPGTSSSVWVPDLLALLESGKNVIGPFCQMQHYRHLANGTALRDKINAACKKGGGVTAYFTGIDPGFTTDVLAYTLSSLCGNIKQIRTYETLDYSTFNVPEMVAALGFAQPPELIMAAGMKTVELNWAGALHLLADAFGVEIERIEAHPEARLAPETFTTVSGLEVKKGTVAALWFKLVGIVKGQPRFVVNHVNFVRRDVMRDWPIVGAFGGYRVEIDGYPAFVNDFSLGLPGGTGSAFGDAMTMTAARLVNSIEQVVLAPEGWRIFLDLQPIGAKYTLGT